MRSISSVLSISAALSLGVAFAGCGGSDGGAAGGASAGSAGVGGHSAGGGGKGGSGGGAGSSVTTGGAAGSSGATSTGGGASAGKGGSAGGSGGAGGASCTKEADCTAPVPVTQPAGCAEWACDPTAKACVARAKDKDGDGHRGAACKAIDGTPITTGDDCDDNDKDTFPGAWDGPADATHPDRCDGKDQNCSGDSDEQKTADGKSCLCNPGDTVTCGEDGGGKTIMYPVLGADGKPLGKCKLGKKTCASDGKFAACVGAIGPELFDICNGGIDDDCDGKADLADDMTPPNLVTWTYDGDSDGYADPKDPTVKTQACDDKAPTVCPKSVPMCDPAKWKLGNLPAKDCDDKNGDVNPAALELCDGFDNDCNGVIDDDYAANAGLWYFDYDGDNYGDINTTPKKSCSAPTTLPAGCATLAANIPSDYCTGVAGEGNLPSCPPAPCDASMWKKNLPNTDCKDRPDQHTSAASDGNNPTLVYPGATDLCNGRDYNCDGSANTGCGCAPVGVEQVCGSDLKCNLAKQTCGSGGQWDTSACLPEKARVGYCPDDDSDGYCDLTKCVTDVCPGAFPADGHKYRDRITCLGFAQPNLGGSDCSDDPTADPDAKSISPGLNFEVCNGDGKDHNCNHNSNLPGGGDCDCIDNDKADCGAAGVSYNGKSPPPLTYPLAQPPDPKNGLAGVCTWGQQTCNAGKWGGCAGGIGALPTEDCSKTDGLDRDCNGHPNSGAGSDCGCVTGTSVACGTCGKGLKTCGPNGQYGSCTGDEAQTTYCLDNDGDGECSATCQLQCPSAPHGNYKLKTNCYAGGVSIDCDDSNLARRHGNAELCTATDEDCDGLPYNGFDFGASCSVGTGSCVASATKVCATTSSTTCNATPGTAMDVYIPTARNGSFDNNCNTVYEYYTGDIDILAVLGTVTYVTQTTCPATVACNPMGGYIVHACASHNMDAVKDAAPKPSYFPGVPGSRWIPDCGSQLAVYDCTPGGSPSLPVKFYKQLCK
jgi:hypothetical protein